ncbi:inverse autotransporter beta domain-containing protein [Citrobacter sp. JGM124]|uniref:inverse autotransporter beta domain-containing protein n=1 Tax=Citrobacter sp. JGM124 TaxID=2799789 RepID=UPI001BA4CAB2|nr:inverse autotransporter beta domain-containing protein [Citrobacter sp. JGM124]MBS0849528.1 inverse autotransporter beta domain-containing protein [Citrobacter sp. JGM124]
MFSKLRLRKSIAYLLIWLQLLTPGLSLLPVIARASEPADMQSTIQGLNALILNDATPAQTSPQPNVPSVSPSIQSDATVPTRDFSDYFHVQAPDPVSSPAVTGLPSLSSPQASSAETTSALPQGAGNDAQEHRLASGASQMGSLLSQDNTTDATINYARSIGEGLINQQVNEWLNQYGNAKVSLGNHKNLSGDLLLPLAETDQSLVFSQLGMRTNQDRNTVNLGVGYRQYINDWMLGINGFYDYDYTGENKRIGVGTEAWTDYLKLAANGYLRQTNWHQSKLGSMEDYDERPANGFDLRANAYLPSWPNLGGSLKYEQYFGKGVSMAESASPDSLKDSPVVVTAGIDYTPFPLMTLSAKRSVGDSNATNVGVDFTYRFGVPWLRQIDPDAVGLMRSLVGSKYDFVDRNYNIVMQYRKQELITISLPATTTAQAAETVPVTLTVSKAKYGLKSVSWDVDPLLTARGGRYQQVSPTELRVTLPAYVFGQRASAAQNYTISAIATDNHGNQSNTAETVIGVIPSENTVSSLTISPDGRVLTVNASRGYTITALVTDGKGAPLASQSLTFSVTGLVDAAGRPGTTLSQPDGSLTDSRQITLTTGADGKASALLFSTVAGQGTVTATMDNGNSNSGRVSFTADVATAEVATLVVVDDNATADGEATNSVLMTVEDKFGNPISGADVYLTASNGARIASVVTTDEQGRATAGLTNTKSGTSTVTASLNGSQKEASVTFGVGRPAQDTSSIRTDRSDYTAGDDMTVSVVLSDAQNNAITGQAGMLTSGAVTVPHASVKATGGWTEDTRSPGTYTRLYVANTMSENQTATLSLTGWSTSSNPYNIIANIRQAVVDSIEVVDNNAEADGTAMNSVRVTVRDDYNNLVNGAVVSLSAGNGALIAASGTTGQEGTILATLTSDRAGMSEVTASLNGSSQSTRVSFGVGQPVRASSTIATDKTTYTSGGEIRVTVVLKDQKQNAVTGLDSARLNGMVTVPNADAGTANNWAETGITGSYTGTYVARLAGENLTAILTVSDGDNRSAAYSIEAGAPVLVNSSITRNSDSYVSGDNITVTVTLKDGNTTPNPVKGLDSATLAGMVSVDNAEAVSTSDWAEAADNPGTYTGIYVAKTVGTGLRATLSIDGADKTSAVYGITAGAAIPAGSGIVTDMTRYTAGAEMVVTVTLRDAQGNAVTGEASALEATTKVPNTTVKSASWKDNHDGSYERTYTASTVGSDLKASLQLSSWSAESQSAAYAITQGAPVQTGGTITTNATTYVAGAEMTVTVILKDAEGNGVTGAADSLADTTTVQHATTNPGSSWTETSEGNYERTYTATTVGSDLKASLQLNGWTTASESAAYAITQGAPVQTGGTIATNATSYVAGADMTVTVTLRDAQGNGVVGEVNAVEAGTTVPSASVKSGSSWTDNLDGTYERTYTATTVGSNLKASLQLSAWDAASESAAYAITANKTETHIVLNWVNNDKLVIANNKDLNVIQGQITDNYGNVISDASIKLTLPSGVSLSSGGTVVRSDSNGNIDFSIFSSISGEVSITAKSTESSDASSTAVATYFSPETIDLIINFTN